jgi:hypothetical protein
MLQLFYPTLACVNQQRAVSNENTQKSITQTPQPCSTGGHQQGLIPGDSFHFRLTRVAR